MKNNQLKLILPAIFLMIMVGIHAQNVRVTGVVSDAQSPLKALTGQTPNDFILSLRLKKATEKLRNDPNALIADIAFDYGFSNPSYFIRCFKNAYDITPAAYRRKYANS